MRRWPKRQKNNADQRAVDKQWERKDIYHPPKSSVTIDLDIASLTREFPDELSPSRSEAMRRSALDGAEEEGDDGSEFDAAFPDCLIRFFDDEDAMRDFGSALKYILLLTSTLCCSFREFESAFCLAPTAS